MLLTEYNSKIASDFTNCSIAFKLASTAPPPSELPVTSLLAMRKVTVALGISPVSEQTFKAINLTCSSSALKPASEIRACKSSSKISCFLSANCLKRAKASFNSASEANSEPNSVIRLLKAFLPECLPKTMRLADQPTSSARIIS